MATNLLRVGLRKEEIRDSNPGLVSLLCSLQLEFLGDLSILAGAIVGTLNPDDSDRLTCSGCFRGEKHDAFSQSLSKTKVCELEKSIK